LIPRNWVRFAEWTGPNWVRSAIRGSDTPVGHSELGSFGAGRIGFVRAIRGSATLVGHCKLGSFRRMAPGTELGSFGARVLRPSFSRIRIRHGLRPHQATSARKSTPNPQRACGTIPHVLTDARISGPPTMRCRRSGERPRGPRGRDWLEAPQGGQARDRRPRNGGVRGRHARRPGAGGDRQPALNGGGMLLDGVARRR
jgi:hypothetical protein